MSPSTDDDDVMYFLKSFDLVKSDSNSYLRVHLLVSIFVL